MNILVIRFSSFGDVALLTPVLSSLLSNNQNLEVTLVTNKNFAPLFNNIERLHIIEGELYGKHKGLVGLSKLALEILNQKSFQFGVDMHQSLRSKIIKLLLRIKGVQFINYIKGRADKKNLTRKENKELKQLPHTIDRYMESFEGMRLNTKINPGPWLFPSNDEKAAIKEFLDSLPQQQYNIGIAPFAKHQLKVWGFDKTKELIDLILKEKNANVFLFGGSADEINQIEQLKVMHPSIINVSSKFNLRMELALMQHLSLMVSMDSANMHLASLSGVHVISIWGPTHPYLGFSAYDTDKSSIVQIDNEKLNCRPCSVYGNKPCFREDHACMQMISTQMVFDQVKTVCANSSPE